MQLRRTYLAIGFPTLLEILLITPCLVRRITEKAH